MWMLKCEAGIRHETPLTSCHCLLQYKAQLDELRTQAQEDMEVAKRKDGLDWVNVDPAQLKPKFT